MKKIYLGCAALGSSNATQGDENKIICAFGKEYAKSLTQKKGKAREMSLLGASLLLSMLELAGIATGSDTRIIRQANGKPYFPAMPKFCFSISHSGNTAVCALSEAGEVGVDLEYIQLPESSRMAVRRRCIASRWLAPRGMDTDDTPEGFLMGWTAFEAASKYMGGTLAACRSIPDGTLLDRFIQKDENRVGVLTLCRNAASTAEALSSLRANGFVPTNMHSRDTVTVLGVAFDRITLKEALRRADRAIKDGSGEVMTVVTPNPVISMLCYKDAEFCRIIDSASMSLADGRGVIDAAKRLKTPLPERVAGIDFGYGLLQLAAKAHAGVFLLGGKPGIAEKAAARLQKMIPELNIRGVCDGYGESEDDAALATAIYASKPRILIVCLGSPRQERWIHEHLPLLREGGVGVAAALGGAVDVWAGKVNRAPKIFIRLRLEWLWRCAAQPHRLKNLPLLVRYRMLTRKKR